MKYLYFLIPLLVTPSCAFAGAPPVLPQSPSLLRLNIKTTNGEKAEGEAVTFDFGDWPMWDNSRESAALASVDPRELWKGLPKVEVSHVFELQNQTQSPITIDKFDVSGAVEEIRSADVGDLPFRLAPGAKGHLEVFIAYQNSYPGPVAGTVRLLANGVNAPLATLNVRAQVKTGIKIEPSMLSWGEVPAGQGSSSSFTVTFDKHLPSIMVPVWLKLVPTNPYLKVVADPTEQQIMGVTVKDDAVRFSNLDKNMPEDLKVKFKVILSKEAPVGKMDGKISLKAVGAPMMSLVRGVEVKSQGAVVQRTP